MVDLNSYLNFEFFGNSGQDVAVALGIFLGLFTILKLFDSSVIAYLKRYAKRTKTDWDDIVIDFINAIHWQFYAYLSIYVASLTLTLPVVLERALGILMVVFAIFYAGQGLSRVVDHFTAKQIEKRKEDDKVENTSMIRVFGILFKIMIWSVAILMFLANMGVEITPLIASLGVGGIAIALALQTVLGDLFSAFAIYFDKPFKEGDFIIVGSDMGVVKRIGIKTTRIQSLGGQELVVSNSELTNSRINNYKKMEKRRIVFGFGVEYDTPLKKLKKINDIVKNIFKGIKEAELDRVHFHKFGDFSLNYEVVYYVNTPDYNKYMDIQQEINFKLKEALEKEKIVFAFPTQTIYLQK